MDGVFGTRTVCLRPRSYASTSVTLWLRRAMRQCEASVHAWYRRDLVPYQKVQQTSALVVWWPKRQQD